MSTFGNPRPNKFYKGCQQDTPWNNDLLWKGFVSKEIEVLEQEPPKAQTTSFKKLSVSMRDDLRPSTSRSRPSTSRSRLTTASTGRRNEEQLKHALIQQITTLKQHEAIMRQKYEDEKAVLEKKYKEAKRMEIAALKSRLKMLQSD